MAKFRDIKTLRKFAAVHASIPNQLNQDRHLNRRDIFKQYRSAALAEWRIRIIDGKYKIVDIVAEGVSLAMTLRSAYGAFISRHGGDVRALITNLREELVAGNLAPNNTKTNALN